MHNSIMVKDQGHTTGNEADQNHIESPVNKPGDQAIGNAMPDHLHACMHVS